MHAYVHTSINQLMYSVGSTELRVANNEEHLSSFKSPLRIKMKRKKHQIKLILTLLMRLPTHSG